MKKINLEKPKNEKKSVQNFNENFFDINKQTFLINQIYLDIEIENKNEIIREIENKINSYKHQDIDKNILSDNLINIHETIEKLVCSKMKCFYCKKQIFLIYKFARDNLQWTLDRIDNNIGHSNQNTVICCLKCNLERRRKSSNAFKFTKQLKICKSI
jgi:phosphomevalonate kinase